MTDRFHSLTVVLKYDIRDDDAEGLCNAINLLQGVLSVEGNVSDPEAFVAEQRARNKIMEKLRDVLWG